MPINEAALPAALAAGCDSSRLPGHHLHASLCGAHHVHSKVKAEHIQQADEGMNFGTWYTDLNNSESPSCGERVKIDVGGTVFKTTLSTLRRLDDSIYSTLTGGGKGWRKQENDRNRNPVLFVDRDPTDFSHVLNYLRDGKNVVLPEDDYTLKSLRREAEFYNLPGLVEICSAMLCRRGTNIEVFFSILPRFI
ncbi:unnamed protein product [Cylicocyclus nassatus]|uniref:BTB domain-containing protein n=1 Tax=Cylicocyclus nassatus TaxID=53992 RepID=A0AA36GJE9_CYLNA|nr:unnamed protein product [Cylicocyclus nassatus]